MENFKVYVSALPKWDSQSQIIKTSLDVKIACDSEGFIPEMLQNADVRFFGERLLVNWGERDGDVRFVNLEYCGDYEDYVNKQVAMLKQVIETNKKAMQTLPSRKEYVFEL